MTDAFATVPGAVVDGGVLQHLGSPLAEQRALAVGRSVAPRGDRALLAVTGDARLDWLDALTTQRLHGLPPGRGTETLVLGPGGRVEHAAGVVDDGATAWLLVDRADADGLLAWLHARRAAGVQPRDARAERAVVAGTAAAVAAVDPAAVVWHDPWPGAAAAGHPAAGRDWSEALVSPARLRRLAWSAQTGTARLAGALAVEALRIAAWRPRVADGDGRMLPGEVDWPRTAIRPDGAPAAGSDPRTERPPRRLIGLQLDGSESILPVHGDAVKAGDVVVGAVLAAAVHHEDGPIGLALVRRDTPVDVDLVVDTEQGPVAAGQEAAAPPGGGPGRR